MFNSISGIVSGKAPQTLFVETTLSTQAESVLEWEFLVSDNALNLFPVVGQPVKVYVWLYHREDAMRYFGFYSAEERSVFLDLMKVDGVGPKAALKILSNISCGDFITALNDENLATLEKIPGIGKKTAQKMLLTLKGKLTLAGTQVVTNVVSSEWDDLVVALVSMGYDKKACEQVVTRLGQELKSKNTTSSQKELEELLFRKAIMELAR